MTKWPIFICYRQADGKATAARLFELLHAQPVPRPADAAPDEPAPTLDVYFDQAAPGVSDWTEIHEPFLKRARAMIVICTPGAKIDEGAGDWVHHEIDWWLANRTMAPILVDPLGEDLRYVPTAIATRWPNAQRIPLIEADRLGLSPEDREELDERTRDRFLGAIVPSTEGFYRQELETEQARAATVRRTRRQLGAAMGVLLLALGAAAWIYTLKTAADAARAEAEVARGAAELARADAEAARDAEAAAKRLVEARAIEGQAARALTEAELMKVLRRVGALDAYTDDMAAWEADFRAHARELRASVAPLLPECRGVAGFLVYEGQLLSFPLPGLPEGTEMAVYLAKVPGSSPRPGDWFPSVLDVFIGPAGSLSGGRELTRDGVKARAAAAGITDRWGLLIGLDTPLVVTLGEQTWRISRDQIAMNDDGDMKMSFDICHEAPAGPGG